MDLLKKVIISIPFISEDQFKTDVQNLIDLGYSVDHIEIRFDYWKEELLDDLIDEVVRFLHSKSMKMIFTYKLQQEQDHEYISILHRLISHKPDYIDLDLNILASTLTELAEHSIQNEVAILYSYHNWEKTPSLETISDLCEFLIQMLPQFSSNTRHILKMVFTATEAVDVVTINNFCKQYGVQGLNLISFCMGKLGRKSRFQSIINGSAYTYAYIGKKTAPGQIHISEMREFLLDAPRS